MEIKNPTSLVFAKHQVTKGTFTEAYTIQADDLNNQTLIAWDGQQLGKDIFAPYILKQRDIIMPNSWFQRSNSMTIVVINHKEIVHNQTINLSDCRFRNGSDYDMLYEVRNVTVSFRYWIMSPQVDGNLSLYKSLVESATEGNSLCGDFLKTGFPIGEDSIEKKLEDVIAKATKNVVNQQYPIEGSTIKDAIKDTINANRYDLFTKYGLNYKDLSVVGLVISKLDDMYNKESTDHMQTQLALIQEDNNHSIEKARAKHKEEIRAIEAEAEQKRNASKPDAQIWIEMLNKNPEGGRIWLKGMKQGPNLNGCYPMVDLRKPAQQIETAKPNQKVQSAALLS